MTLGILIWIVIIGGVLYLIMKKGGGCCCGGHDHGGHGQDDHTGHAHGETGHHHMDHGEQAKAEKDPVCGMAVDEKSGLSSKHHGKLYNFCSEHCQKSFDADPDKYV